MPGVPDGSPLLPLLQKAGYRQGAAQVALYLNLKNYVPDAGVPARIAALQQEGITVGRYDPALGYDFHRLCDRVQSAWWRSALEAETAAPAPRPILAATVPGYLVGFTGPVDVQASGRGWFTGICTDPYYEKRGIATALFHLLMQEFIAAGAAFSTLYTGENNHARRIYERAGFTPALRFLEMKKVF